MDLHAHDYAVFGPVDPETAALDVLADKGGWDAAPDLWLALTEKIEGVECPWPIYLRLVSIRLVLDELQQAAWEDDETEYKTFYEVTMARGGPRVLSIGPITDDKPEIVKTPSQAKAMAGPKKSLLVPNDMSIEDCAVELLADCGGFGGATEALARIGREAMQFSPRGQTAKRLAELRIFIEEQQREEQKGEADAEKQHRDKEDGELLAAIKMVKGLKSDKANDDYLVELINAAFEAHSDKDMLITEWFDQVITYAQRRSIELMADGKVSDSHLWANDLEILELADAELKVVCSGYTPQQRTEQLEIDAATKAKARATAPTAIPATEAKAAYEKILDQTVRSSMP